MRGLTRTAAAAVVTLVALVGFAPAAFAHNQLISSNPANEAVVETGPQAIELTFDQAVQGGEGLNSIVVVGPNGTDQWQGGEATVRDNVVTAPLRPLGPAGQYRVGYRILSADGHPVSGEIKFTLTKAGDGTPAPPTEASNATAVRVAEESGGIPVWVWIIGAVVLLGAGVVLALRVGGGAKQ